MRTIIIYKRIFICYADANVPWAAAVARSLRSTLESLMKPVSSFRALTLVTGALLAFSVVAQEVASFKLVARDGVFEPSVIEVPAGKRFRIEIVNEGKTAIEFESRDLKQEKVVPPGGKATVTINALKAGEYRFFDEFHEKTGQGRIVAK
jgi:plastocyanin